MKGKTQDGSIALKGWIDAKTMDMDTSLKIQGNRGKDVLSPIIGKGSLREIESGALGMIRELP